MKNKTILADIVNGDSVDWDFLGEKEPENCFEENYVVNEKRKVCIPLREFMRTDGKYDGVYSWCWFAGYGLTLTEGRKYKRYVEPQKVFLTSFCN